MENDKTEGATFDVYLGVPGDDIEPILQGAKAGARDPSIEGLQTFGDVRGLARVVTIIGIVGSGGKFSISEVRRCLRCLGRIPIVFVVSCRRMRGEKSTGDSNVVNKAV